MVGVTQPRQAEVATAIRRDSSVIRFIIKIKQDRSRGAKGSDYGISTSLGWDSYRASLPERCSFRTTRFADLSTNASTLSDFGALVSEDHTSSCDTEL